VQQFYPAGKKVCFIFKKQPHKPVSFKGKRAWAKGVRPGLQPSVWQKLSVCFSIYRTFHIIPVIENCNHPQKVVTDILNIFSRNFPQDKTDNIFHSKLKFTTLSRSGLCLLNHRWIHSLKKNQHSLIKRCSMLIKVEYCVNIRNSTDSIGNLVV